MEMTKNSKLFKDAFKVLRHLELEIESEAEDLAIHFNETRQDLLQKAQAEINARDGNQAKRIWCGLNLSYRILNASLQITWYTLHFNPKTKKKKFISLPKGKSDAYDLRRLKSHANDFEWELVKDTDRKAAELRKAWKRVIAARAQFRYLYQSLDDE